MERESLHIGLIRNINVCAEIDNIVHFFGLMDMPALNKCNLVLDLYTERPDRDTNTYLMFRILGWGECILY